MPFKGTQIRDSIDKGNYIDLQVIPKGEDNEITGAYGIKGGNTSVEVRTKGLSKERIQEFRDYLVDKYKPKAHKEHYDMFFETAHYEDN